MSESASRGPFSRRTDRSGPRGRVRDLLPYLAEHRGVLIGVIGLSLLTSAASLAQPLIVNTIVGDVQTGADYSGLVWLVVALLVVSALIGGLAHYLLQRTGTAVVLSARRRLIHRLLRLPIPEFDARRTGDLVSRVGADTTLLYAVMTQGLVDAVGGVVVFIGALIAMGVLDWVLLLLVVAVVAFAVLTVGLLSRRVRAASHAQQDAVGRLASAVERAVSGIRTVRAANATEREEAGVLVEADGAYRAGVGVARASAAIVPLAGITLQLAFLVVLGVGGFRVAAGITPIGSLIAFVMFLFLMVMPLGNAFGAISAVNQALGAIGRIQEVIDLPSEGEEAASEVSAPSPVSTSPVSPSPVSTSPVSTSPVSPSLVSAPSVAPQPELGRLSPRSGVPAAGAGRVRETHSPIGGSETNEEAAIEFAGVDFGYATSAEPVLHGVSFVVPRGRRTALVGPSGAGKSTILALVERFYEPTGGVVRFGGEDVRSLDRAALRAQIGYVEQDAPVLAGTLRDNLLIGSPTATDEECAAVLRTVNLGEVLDRDPAGLDAQVGEDGIMLSGGERQRLAIARALLAAPPVLLLDEATASLDANNEAQLRRAIDAAAEDRTVLVIAHRLSTVVDSDQIVVLDHGRVVGRGTHAELVESTPLYAELARHQLLV